MIKNSILIVDDVPMILQFISAMLANQGYQVHLATDGKMALKFADETLPDLILLDIHMPGMDGYETCERLKANEKTRDIPVIFVSALDDTFDKVKAFSIGGVDYITKPFEIKEVLVRIKTHLSLRNLQKRLEEKNKQLEAYARQLEELQQERLYLLNQAYERFVPHQFLELLGKKSIVDINLGDQIEREMTILFSDIRGFTSISEKMTPQDNFDFINTYVGQMEPIIHQHKGIIDKYIGDAIMALFPYGADDAVNSAIAMLKKLGRYNQILQTAGLPAIKIGIGIHTGTMMLGTIGGQNRMDSTVISDAVNIASRLEDLTKTYGTPLLISEATYLKLSDTLKPNTRLLACERVKGKSKYINIFEVFSTDSQEM